MTIGHLQFSKIRQCKTLLLTHAFVTIRQQNSSGSEVTAAFKICLCSFKEIQLRNWKSFYRFCSRRVSLTFCYKSEILSIPNISFTGGRSRGLLKKSEIT